MIIGEFIRRHHARLAHEIAIFGFPGLPEGISNNEFPAMGGGVETKITHLADLIGVTARSHGTSLRVAKAYLDFKYGGTPQPMGTAALYPMALLRVADYMQIEHQRAPAVLLQLRNPPSPISVQEWKKHLAVQHIGPATDPRAKMVTVSPNISLELYLQLKDLLEGIQSEIDHSIAVLDEAYGVRSDLGLDKLSLATRRIHSNLHSESFRNSLPYVPEKTGFAADPNLLTLLVKPLYGDFHGVGIRELMQNSVDAVRELHAWCDAHELAMDSTDLLEQEPDVLIDFIKRDDGSWFLRVSDRGIGMTSSTIQNYFLRAGASFRQSPDWAKEFLDDNNEASIPRTGRFGVGAFAIFLLGPRFRLTTRHVDASIDQGCEIEVSSDSQLIEIQRKEDLKIGTIIEIELSTETIKSFDLNDEYYSYLTERKSWQNRMHVLKRQIGWYCLSWPHVEILLSGKDNIEIVPQEDVYNINSLEWSVIYPDGFDAVYWTFAFKDGLSCNGIRIGGAWNSDVKDQSDLEGIGCYWPHEELELSCPHVLVFDSNANLPLTVQRYELAEYKLPFIDDLLHDVLLSFVAHSLVIGPLSLEDSLKTNTTHPLGKTIAWRYMDRIIEDEYAFNGLLRWCSTAEHFVPSDPWLFSLLASNKYLIYGRVGECSKTSGHIHLGSSYKEQAIIKFGKELRDDSGVQSSYIDDNTSELLKVISVKGLTALAGSIRGSNFMLWTNRLSIAGQNLSENDSWQQIACKEPNRLCYEFKYGSFESTEVNRNDWQQAIPPEVPLKKGSIHINYYIGEVEVETQEVMPESRLAKCWSECLGPNPIPYDIEARKSLIEKGKRHPQLKVHLEKWEELKRTDSKWCKRDPKKF